MLNILRNGATILATTLLSSQAGNAEPFKFLSMWSSPGEQHALGVFEEKASEVGLEWENIFSLGNFNGTRSAFVKLMFQGDAPHAVQWIIGEELTHLMDNGLTVGIKDPDDVLLNLLQPEVRSAVSTPGGLSSLPVGIHTQNHILYNKRVFDSLDLDIPTSLAELLAVIPILHENGIVPVSMSDQEWQMRNMFMTVLSATMTQGRFEALLLRGDTSPEIEALLIKAFESFRAITEFANADVHDLEWNKATNQVVAGTAAMQIIGDYLGSELPADGDFICAGFPDSEFVVWGADGMVFTSRSDEFSGDKMVALSRLILSRDTITEFIIRKGGIPTVVDYDESRLGSCSQQNIQTWNTTKGKVWLDSDTWRTTLATIGAVSSFAFNNREMSAEDGASRVIATLKSSR